MACSSQAILPVVNVWSRQIRWRVPAPLYRSSCRSFGSAMSLAGDSLTRRVKRPRVMSDNPVRALSVDGLTTGLCWRLTALFLAVYIRASAVLFVRLVIDAACESGLP